MSEIPRDLQMRYLYAIQMVPGDTANEKLSWIGKLTSHQASGDPEQLPPELLPILRVEIAVKKKRHEDIASALKSEDSTIVTRALKASWFFDGSHKKIVDVEYFCERLFPYVSMNTRARIVNTLAHQLADKDSVFAQQMFTAVTAAYGVQDAYPLLVACDEIFAYKIIIEKKLMLPYGIFKKIFRKNPDLAVRFLKLLRPYRPNSLSECSLFAINIDRYKSFLPKLIKKRLEAFVELYEMYENQSLNITLSNTCTEIFLRKGQQYLTKKPLLYIRILPLKKINAELIESIFPDLLPPKISSFKTDNILDYLKHYPQDKKYELLRNSYRSKYDAELLDETKNVTPALLRLLPAEERIKQARIKIEKEDRENVDYKNTMTYETAWVCYLPINEAIPAIKEKISKTSGMLDRFGLISQMIYACKINEDDDALANTLTYFINRHKNEEFWVFERTMDQLLQIYDVPHLSERLCSLVMDIIRLFYVKYGYMAEEILVAIVHFNLLHNMPIEELILMLLETNNNRWYINFNILKEYPEYEKQCLVTFTKLMQDRYRTQEEQQHEDDEHEEKEEERDNRKRTLCRLIVAMYDFNDRCEKSHTKIERMTIKNYPWIMDTICAIIRSKEDFWDVRDVLQTKESELYRSWFPSSKNIANVTSGAALALLKRDPQSILDNWEQYLVDCMKNSHRKHVQHFVRATRWYKDIPIKFAERCTDYLNGKRKDEMSSSLAILAILLHGDILTKLIDPLTPTETTVDASHPEARDNYKFVHDLPLCMRLSNPPIPLDLVTRLCEGDYLSIGLMTLTNVSRRSSLPKVISVAQKLTTMRVSVRKHGIRLMYMIAPVRELSDFLQNMWLTESHHSVRQVLFETVQRVFLTKPAPETWSLYSRSMSILTLRDEALLSEMKLISSVPNEYIARYFEVWLETIEDFRKIKLDIQKVNKYTTNCLNLLVKSVCNLLSEEFAENILRRFLFHIDTGISEAANHFTILYLLSEDKDKLATRIKIFNDIFHNAVTNRWNVPHPKKSRFYPVNNAVRLFMNDFVVSYIDKACFNKSVDPQIIDNIWTTFSSALLPTQDAKSYLMLTYAKKLQECMSTKESFGLKLGRQVPELVDTFSLLLVPFMAEILKYFVESAFNEIDVEEVKLAAIEGLVDSGSTDACFMAVILLPPVILKNHAARYDRLIEKFRGMHNPAIRSVLYDYLNKKDFKSVIFD